MLSNYPGPSKTLTVGAVRMELPRSLLAFKRLKDYVFIKYDLISADLSVVQMTDFDRRLTEFIECVTVSVMAIESYAVRHSSNNDAARSLIESARDNSVIIDHMLSVTSGLADEFDKDVYRAAAQYGLCLDALRDIVAFPSYGGVIARRTLEDIRRVEDATMLM